MRVIRERRKAKIFGMESSSSSSSDSEPEVSVPTRSQTKSRCVSKAAVKKPTAANPKTNVPVRVTPPAANKKSAAAQHPPVPAPVIAQYGRGMRTIRRPKILGVDSSSDDDEPVKRAISPPSAAVMLPQSTRSRSRSLKTTATSPETPAPPRAPPSNRKRCRSVAALPAKQPQHMEANQTAVVKAAPTTASSTPSSLSPQKSSEVMSEVAATATRGGSCGDTATLAPSSRTATMQLPVAMPVVCVSMFSTAYYDTTGVPFGFGNGTMGVWFRDGSCVTLQTASSPARYVFTYINKHRHRFSLVTPQNDGMVCVPRRLEKKVFCALWCRRWLPKEKHEKWESVPGLALTEASVNTKSATKKTAGAVNHHDGFVVNVVPLDWIDVADASETSSFPPFVSRVDVVSDGQDALNVKKHVTFHVSNQSTPYPNDSYYASDTEE